MRASRHAFSSSFSLLTTILAIVMIGSTGCQPPSQKTAVAETPAIPVSKPVEREVTDYVDFTGRLEAKEAVNIVPRVTGYLNKIHFREGSEVKEGELLFEIDPRPYQAQLDQADGQVRLYEAQLKLARTSLARDREIAKTPGAVTLQQIDQDQAAVDEAEARVKAFKASTEVYKLNLGFTRVTSPISGQISRYYLTAGNLVNQDQTLLTTVVSLAPIHAYFDMDESRLQLVNKAGKIKLLESVGLPVLMGLQSEDGYPHKGTINFVNNQVSPTTGSLSVRGVFDNPKPAGGVRLMSPGMFARIRLPLGQAHKELLIVDRAISFDLDHKFVYVIDAEKKAQSRRVVTGSLQEDGLRVISDGLKPTRRAFAPSSAGSLGSRSRTV